VLATTLLYNFLLGVDALKLALCVLCAGLWVREESLVFIQT
jgi:hypothetical protein